MANSCEIIYRGVDEKGQRLPRLVSFGEIPFLHTSRLPACIRGKVELGLAIGVVFADGIANRIRRIPTMVGSINRLVSENHLQVALAIVAGTLAIGVASTAATCYYASSAERQIAETQAIIQRLAK